jgi:hypothetical protein
MFTIKKSPTSTAFTYHELFKILIEFSTFLKLELKFKIFHTQFAIIVAMYLLLTFPQFYFYTKLRFRNLFSKQISLKAFIVATSSTICSDNKGLLLGKCWIEFRFRVSTLLMVDCEITMKNSNGKNLHEFEK